MQKSIAVVIYHQRRVFDATLIPAGDLVWRETLVEQCDRAQAAQAAREQAARERRWNDWGYNPSDGLPGGWD